MRDPAMRDPASGLTLLQEIALLAGVCRRAQQAYFRQRDRESLIQAKACEHALDSALAELPPITEKPGGWWA
jgi:hypothetical protein